MQGNRTEIMSSGHERAGFSLLEALLATAILLGCVAVLAQLASVGRYHVQSVQDRSTAQLLCQKKLNELLCGALPLEDVSERTLETDPDWLYSVEVVPVPDLPMLSVRVTVTQRQDEQLERSVRHKPCSFQLVRWVADPEQQITGLEGSSTTSDGNRMPLPAGDLSP